MIFDPYMFESTKPTDAPRPELQGDPSQDVGLPTNSGAPELLREARALNQLLADALKASTEDVDRLRAELEQANKHKKLLVAGYEVACDEWQRRAEKAEAELVACRKRDIEICNQFIQNGRALAVSTGMLERARNEMIKALPTPPETEEK